MMSGLWYRSLARAGLPDASVAALARDVRMPPAGASTATWETHRGDKLVLGTHQHEEDDTSAIPKCLACSTPMVLRCNSITSVPFWGCRNYPTCREVDADVRGWCRFTMPRYNGALGVVEGLGFAFAFSPNSDFVALVGWLYVPFGTGTPLVVPCRGFVHLSVVSGGRTHPASVGPAQGMSDRARAALRAAFREAADWRDEDWGPEPGSEAWARANEPLPRLVWDEGLGRGTWVRPTQQPGSARYRLEPAFPPPETPAPEPEVEVSAALPQKKETQMTEKEAPKKRIRTPLLEQGKKLGGAFAEGVAMGAVDQVGETLIGMARKLVPDDNEALNALLDTPHGREIVKLIMAGIVHTGAETGGPLVPGGEYVAAAARSQVKLSTAKLAGQMFATMGTELHALASLGKQIAALPSGDEHDEVEDLVEAGMGAGPAEPEPAVPSPVRSRRIAP